jgi:hypothetical protein
MAGAVAIDPLARRRDRLTASGRRRAFPLKRNGRAQALLAARGFANGQIISEIGERESAPVPFSVDPSVPNKVLSARAAEARVPIIEKPLLSNALLEKIHEVCARV